MSIFVSLLSHIFIKSITINLYKSRNALDIKLFDILYEYPAPGLSLAYGAVIDYIHVNYFSNTCARKDVKRVRGLND